MKNSILFLAGILFAANLSAQSKFNLAEKSVMLNSGYTMPILGLGTWTLDDATAERCVYEAIKCGYRLFDTAKYYGTEAGVGRGVRRAISEGLVTREEIFVTSKVTPWGYSDFDEAIDECNRTIGLGYIDLMLIHQSGNDEIKLYRAIERAVEKGIVRSLGISNYYTPKDYDRITKNAKILPAVIQNENHPFHQNAKLQEYVAKFGICVESYYPLGGRGHTRDLFNHKTISQIAASHKKTSAQVLIRWHLQSGYIAIPGSGNHVHITENFSVFDFSLTDDEMQKIAAMNTGKRYENW